MVVDQLGFSSTYKYLYPAIERYPNKFELLKELKNPNTYLMKFRPELGYWGEWKNGKRNGFGKYNWEDGQRFEGYWKDDLRSGEGVLYFDNNQKLKGVWTNDLLNGKVRKYNANDELVEIALYKNNKKIKVLEIKK